MKKVLLAFDGEHFSPGVFEFVKQMNSHAPVLAVGVFLPAIDYVELLYSFGGVPAGPMYMNEVVAANEESVKRNISYFRNECARNGIECIVHKDAAKHIISRLANETRFADLLVLGSKTFYENIGEDAQEDYIVNVTHKAECPVVLVPEDYEAPENIIFAYDGSDHSVFAIKQFNYLFPYYTGMKALLVNFSDRGKVPQREEIEELLVCYYKDISITQVGIHNQKETEDWMLANTSPMLVSGAFGRSLLSEFIKKSFITEIMRDHKLTVFVTHR